MLSCLHSFLAICLPLSGLGGEEAWIAMNDLELAERLVNSINLYIVSSKVS